MIRAAAAPDRFLTRGYARFISRSQAVHPRAPARASSSTPVVELPLDLVQLLVITDGRTLGDFVPRVGVAAAFAKLLETAGRAALARARLCALLAGTVPFGATRGGELWLYVLGEPTSPARGVIATLDPAVPGAPRLAFRNASSFAFACALDASAAAGEDASRVTELRTCLATPGVAEQEGVRASFERATALVDLLGAGDAAVRRAAKKLASRPFEPPHPPPARSRKGDRRTPLALGALVEAFFRKETDEALAIVTAQRASGDALVREAAALLEDALATKTPRSSLARELARRRTLALRAARTVARAATPSLADRVTLTRLLVERVDATKPAAEPLATTEPREEALHALAELGDRSAVPGLVARAVTGDVGAVDMLASLGDVRAVAPLAGLLRREPQRYRILEAGVARALASLDARSAAPALRELLADNPMPSWREGIERGVLVKELVAALGALRDEHAGPLLQAVLESTSQEYRAILPLAAWALGRIHHEPALGTLERLLASPKEPATCEAIWAVGEIGAAHPAARARAGVLLDGLRPAARDSRGALGNEPGAELVRLTALAKVRARTAEAPRSSELRRALERALWEPAFRQEESSRRRTWAFRSLEELAAMRSTKRAAPRVDDADPYFLGHDAVRYFVTRDDHRVRRAAQDAFVAWGVTVPATRRYYAFLLDDLEARGGLSALHEALRDPLGVFRHNVATRLAERAHPSSVRPLAEAVARLFAEPPTSTYEYDDAPSHLVAFVRALAKLNRPEGNDVLIEGLRAGNHQVRAVVAENAPDDERFVPELMAMLGDPRSFLRSRAERSLASLGVSPRGSDRPTRLLEV